ncbi:hypothetical protein [Actimicrobium sp. CCI2.3]|uniref:hypothetical protein n=1 Tax=Actimicrobium sp. CCI2.3 TaxID=3048616 RepID=UPI002AB3582F|nr:hypothetical protein [Actimicrobium sp. CCI2.3]MDY7573924.1 hypothetical protein [Actimicrobium sp. CCI2.3]MEB0023056.1 hypothetical protein [Actimicrobium sp. CCI2.3]
MKFEGSVKRKNSNPRPVERMPSIEEESDESSKSNSSSSLDSGANTNVVVPGNNRHHVHPASRSAIEKNMKRVISKKQSEIFDHHDNMARLEPLKSERKNAENQQKNLRNNYGKEKNKLEDIRQKRSKAEKLFDRQVLIADLDSRNGALVKARLLFIRRLDEVDQVLVESRQAINKDVARTEKKLLFKSNAVTENVAFISAKKDEIVLLEKNLQSTAARLYVQVRHLEKENKKLTGQSPIFTHPKIKNGKYLLMPLLRTGQFRSFGAQLAYQARRIKKKWCEASAAGSEVQTEDFYRRIEV